MERFHNHVQTILYEPESTIDMPFTKDIAFRSKIETVSS